MNIKRFLKKHIYILGLLQIALGLPFVSGNIAEFPFFMRLILGVLFALSFLAVFHVAHARTSAGADANTLTRKDRE